ncbi:MAG: Flp pilus assembly complex ATPase component TadA [Propionibacteriaceae bacterium]|jgi:Flp pilus assembly CpaF family ATPase|nr:Flp pilus assembly complex ATPase component TadA [Propionibacteriaceae bacterium]
MSALAVVAAPSPAAEPGVDWEVVRKLRRMAVEIITEHDANWIAEHDVPMPTIDRRLLGRATIRAVVRNHIEHQAQRGELVWSLEVERSYARAIENAVFGYGRLQPLFELADAENIEIHGSDVVYAQFGDGTRAVLSPVADSDAELVEAIRFLGQTADPPRPFDAAHPVMTLALGDRFRLHAIGFGLCDRPAVTIRQHLLTEVTLSELAARGMLSEELAWLLLAAVRARLSIVISGDQGAGKTTLLRALIAAIPAMERFGTLETDYELLTQLRVPRPNVVALQARVGLGELQGGRHVGEYSVADLIPEALRQNLTRLVVGEVRGSEAGAMFEAMQSGAGTMSTTHSHSATGTIDRLAARVAQGGVVAVPEAYRQIAHHLGLIIHVRLDDDTWCGGRRTRYVDEVVELTGDLENGRPVTQVLYRCAPDGTVRFTPSDRLSAELARFTAEVMR